MTIFELVLPDIPEFSVPEANAQWVSKVQSHAQWSQDLLCYIKSPYTCSTAQIKNLNRVRSVIASV